MFLAACSSEKEKEPIVTVQVAAVETTTIQHTVNTEAILYPRQQAAIVPKISAPVQRFLVNRGSRVRAGELLAVLENRDLTAATQENKGRLEEAQAAYETATAASLPEEIQKAEADMQQAQQALNAEEKVYESRQQLFEQGALPRKELDQSRVDITQARNQAAIAKKHLEVLMAIGKEQQLKAAAGQLESARGKYRGAEAQLSYSEIRSPIDGVVTERPLYPGEMATAGTPIVTVMDVSSLIAKAHIPQSDAALLKVGDRGTMTAPGLEEVHRRDCHGGKPGPRPQQHDRGDVVGSEECPARVEAGDERSTFFDRENREGCTGGSGGSRDYSAGWNVGRDARGQRRPRSPEGSEARHPPGC